MTLADIEADLLDYADFEQVGSVSRAQSFVTAANRWLILKADSASNQSSSMTIGKNYVSDMLKRAQAFVTANSSTGSVSFLQPGSFFR
jgi:hypothetical protein